MTDKVSLKSFLRPNIKTLPWRQLFLSSLLTITIATVISVSVVVLVNALSSILFDSPSILTKKYPIVGRTLGISILVGYGALGVYLFECLYSKIRLTKHILWAMFVCLTFSGWLGISLITQKPYPLPACTAPFVLVAAGVFVKGRSYWR